MNFQQLRYFLALAETGSFTRAAEATYVAQPSLSQQIRALEADLGGELVERHPGGIRLTAAGEAFLPEARQVLRAVEHARQTVAAALGLAATTMDIATVRTLAMRVLPTSIQRWYQTHPEARIRLHELSDALSMEQAVRGGSGLLGFGPRPKSWNGAMRQIGWDGLVLVLPAGDALLASGDAIRLESLADRPWVLYEQGHGLRALIDGACEQLGFRPTSVAETGQVETAVRLAASGLGPTLAPLHGIPSELRDVVRPLERPIAWEVVAFARTRWPSLVDEYLDTFGDSPILRQCPANALVVEPNMYPPKRD